MYMLIAFICAGGGFALALNRRPIPAVALFILAILLFSAALSRHP